MTHKKRGLGMIDRDFGGSSVATIEYYITFTRPNFERTLKIAVFDINYSTNPKALSGQLESDFWSRAKQGKEPEALQILLDAWYRDIRDIANPEVPIPTAQLVAAPPVNWTIKEEDKKFVTFGYQVLTRTPQPETQYDREQVDVLRETRDAVNNL
jgi:hypothetical protein